MSIVGRLDQYASMLAWEFDDYSMSENLLLHSEEFNNAYWTKIASSITQNSVVAPDGLSTADTLIENTSNGSHAVARNVTKPTSAITYTLSLFAKLKDTRNIQFILSASDVSGLAGVTVNLSTGVISSGPITSGTFSNTSAKVQSYPNGWYRIALTTTSNTVTPITVNIYTANGTSTTYTGDGASGIYIWGAQLEESSVATDYTPTTTTEISRVLASTTNTNITGLGTYYGSGFDENVGFTTFLSANISPPYDPVYDEFSGTLFGPGRGRYMRQNTDKSVIVYNEIDEVTDFYGRSVVRDGLVLDIDAGISTSYSGIGTSWTDLGPISKNGTLTNGPTYSSTNGGSIVFDGTNDYASIPSPSPFSGTKLFTFEIWVNFTSITGNFGGTNKNAWLFAGGTGTGVGQAEFAVRSANNTSFTPNTIDFSRGGGGTTGSLSINVSSLIFNGNWYQIVLVRSASNAQTVYLNGLSIGTGNVSNSFSDGQTDFGSLHGNASFDGYLNGRISNIKIYDRALTASEVQQNYNALRGRFGL